MYLRFVGKSGFILSSLVAATFAYANVDGKQIPCPSINTIQQAALKIDSALKFNDGYTAATSASAFQESGIMWYVGMNKISANSPDDAIEAGKEGIKNISIRNRDFALELQYTYLCTYGPGEVVALGAEITTSISPMMFKR